MRLHDPLGVHPKITLRACETTLTRDFLEIDTHTQSKATFEGFVRTHVQILMSTCMRGSDLVFAALFLAGTYVSWFLSPKRIMQNHVKSWQIMQNHAPENAWKCLSLPEGASFCLKMPDFAWLCFLRMAKSAWCPENPRTKKHKFVFAALFPDWTPTWQDCMRRELLPFWGKDMRPILGFSQGWTCSRSLKHPLKHHLRCLWRRCETSPSVWGARAGVTGPLRRGTLRGTARGTIRDTLKAPLGIC